MNPREGASLRVGVKPREQRVHGEQGGCVEMCPEVCRCGERGEGEWVSLGWGPVWEEELHLWSPTDLGFHPGSTAGHLCELEPWVPLQKIRDKGAFLLDPWEN